MTLILCLNYDVTFFNLSIGDLLYFCRNFVSFSGCFLFITTLLPSTEKMASGAFLGSTKEPRSTVPTAGLNYCIITVLNYYMYEMLKKFILTH